MTTNISTRLRRRKKRSGATLLRLALSLMSVFAAQLIVLGAGNDEALHVSSNFSVQEAVAPNASIELQVDRPVREGEGRLAVFIQATDVTGLFKPDGLRLRYQGNVWPLPLGESTLTVYLVSGEREWKEIARFQLRVGKAERSETSLESGPSETEADSTARFTRAKYQWPAAATATDEWMRAFAESISGEQSAAGASQNAGATKTDKKNRKIKFTPSLTLTVNSQPAQSTFPGPRPVRATFTEVNMQASLKNDSAYGIFSTQSSFDFAGSSFEQEALRFGTLGKDAPQIDLSSYLVQIQTGKVKYQLGHFSYGTQRQLINSFSSRGIEITVPFLQRFDFSVAAMNGTQLVGYDNFFGLNKSKHQMLSGTLGIEFIRKRPGGLRLEVSALNAYFQPISGVNRGVVTDLQRSRGLALRLIANDKAGRFHFEGGFTRSFFASPGDQSLNQGISVVPLPDLTRNAHYLEASYQILKDHALSKTKIANLSVAFREENVAPLFRSLGASTQADKIQYEFSVNGSINEITAQFGRTNFHDNLRRIPSILRSLTGNTHLGLAAPASALLNLKKSSVWLPRLGYSYDRVHAFGAEFPVNGGFEIDPSSVPNLIGTNQTFSADWQVKRFTWGYNLNRSLQDNRQTGRERADQAVLVNTGRVGIAASRKLNLNFDLSAESSFNKETGRIDRTYRVGPGVTWQLTKHMGLGANLSNTVAGDAARTSHRRNTEFDASWTYRFERGKEGMRRVSGQFFIRYANHYSHSLERLFFNDSLQKNQTLTANLGLTFF